MRDETTKVRRVIDPVCFLESVCNHNKQRGKSGGYLQTPHVKRLFWVQGDKMGERSPDRVLEKWELHRKTALEISRDPIKKAKKKAVPFLVF